MLGAGLVEVPPVPYRDPASAVMRDPQIPEHKRFCANCGSQVGRSRGPRPGRTEGFCAECGTGFSFVPKLSPGELVSAQYEVLGCLAHGGLGWVYLAKDRNVSDRWVVLKGLLDSGDPDAMAAAVAERRFLAAVEHPTIVKIYNFVRHFGADYIVMEYVGGRSLREIVLERRRATGESLPLPQVIAYGLEVLRAFDYLHDQGLVYCDFKPGNAIQTEEQLRLVDLGAVRRIDDPDGPIYGTAGFEAPEIADVGPSPQSDLYTVARVMAVLAFEFTGYTSAFRHTLPDRDQVPVLVRHESFDRLLRRATDPDPARRFRSAGEMAEQLTAVLREVLAAEDGSPRPSVSSTFEPERKVIGARGGTVQHAAQMATALPLPLDNAADLRQVRTHVETGAFEQARELLAGKGDDWRVTWYRGLCALSEGDHGQAAQNFDRIYDLLPGESAPKLGLAFCAELAGDHAIAARYHELVWRTDHSNINAAFGLARARVALRDRAGAVQALASVPTTSRHYVDAQITAILALIGGRQPKLILREELLEATRRLEGLGLPIERRERLAALVLEAALGQIQANGNSMPAGDARVLGLALTERDVRFGLERTYRALARLAANARERVALIERANAMRPATLL